MAYHEFRAHPNQRRRNRQRQKRNIDMQLGFLPLVIGILQFHLLCILPGHGRRHFANLRDPPTGIPFGDFHAAFLDFRTGSVVDLRVRSELKQEVACIDDEEHDARPSRQRSHIGRSRYTC